MVQGYLQKIVEVQVDGVPSVPPSDSVPSSPLGENPVKKDSSFPCRTQTPESVQRPGALPVRICVELTLSSEPSDGDIYIVMSKDRRIVRLFAYDNRSYRLFEKKFVAGYQFMRIIKDDECNEVAYRIDWLSCKAGPHGIILASFLPEFLTVAEIFWVWHRKI